MTKITNGRSDKATRYPLLYQINTRVWLTQLSREAGRQIGFDDIQDVELDRLAAMGFDWIWLLSVWQTGPESQDVSRRNTKWRHEFAATLPDLSDDDIGGSGFAITEYKVHEKFGGSAALGRLRERLAARGLKLMLDFVPNHVGLGHQWVDEHPEYFVHGTEEDLVNSPQNFLRVRTKEREWIFAHGRDPYFPGWPDTLQLNYANPSTQEAMMNELSRVSKLCDGVRCDMAMLVLPEVFERTWGKRAPLFWPEATRRIREVYPAFLFMAEVYWDLEWTLQQQVFDYAYDKRLYDRLHDGNVRAVRAHFRAELQYQEKLARFLENHDEPRAATIFSADMQQAAAVISFLCPGLRFFHQGQFEGKTKKISPHLIRAPIEPVDESIWSFYMHLLRVLRQPIFHEGAWQLLDCTPGWDGNWTVDCFVVFGWLGKEGESAVAAVNYAPHQSQCHVRLPFEHLAGKRWHLRDQLSSASYEWNGDDLLGRGLFLDMPAWHVHVFSLVRAAS